MLTVYLFPSSSHCTLFAGFPAVRFPILEREPKCFSHSQSRQTWHDLRKLEISIGERYLTHPAEEAYMYAKEVPEKCATATGNISTGIISGDRITNTIEESSEPNSKVSSVHCDM